jgi:DNA polymerase-1
MADYFMNDPDPDLHVRTAAGMYGIALEDVSDAQRQVGKRLNFSIVYGGGVPTLLRQGAAKDGKEAMEMLRAFHGAWPGIGWESRNRPADEGTLFWWIKERIQERAREHGTGYVTTLWGRHLHPRSVHSSLNALIQGCAADLMKWALIEIDQWCIDNALVSHLVNVVHDEAMMDAVEEELGLLAEHVPALMNEARLAEIVPILPAPEISYTTWADKKPLNRKAA